MHIIGVDAGGTKTLLALYDLDGNKLNETVLESCHYMRVGASAMGRILKEGVNALCQQQGISPRDIILSLGLAGYGREEKVRRMLEEALKAAFPETKLVLHNDVETALEGAFLGRDGLMLIAGTGSIAFLKQGDEVKRCGGWGYAFGDEGSAYWIAKKLLEAFAKEDDGRLEKTALHPLLMERLKLSQGADLITYVMKELQNDRNQVAKLAVLAGVAAALGDPVALAIYNEAGKELAALANTLGQSLDQPVSVAVYGGVFQAGNWILKPLKANLASNLNLVEPKAPPEYGAYLMAKNN